MHIFQHHYFAHFERGKERDFKPEVLTGTIVCLIEKGLLFPRKMVCEWNLPYFQVNGICRWCTYNSHILV